MRTAIDSSVMLAILNREAGYEKWETALENASLEGTLLICPVAFAEVSPRYSSLEKLQRELKKMRVCYDPISPKASWLAGQIFMAYRRAGGPRSRMIPDFLIAAHAREQADRLAAVDRGYLRAYFPKLELLGPAPASE